MVYVKHFDILGIDTMQIPCIELQGAPTTATVGAVGLLGMDVTSESREIYVCTAVNGAIYTWQSLKDGKDGACVTKAEINDNGELILTLSNGTTLNAGVVKGNKGDDGIDGADGENGISITDTQINDNGELVISFSDGTEKNVGVVKGANGEDGISVVKAEINANYELIITLSNDTLINLGSIKSDYAAKADDADTLDGYHVNNLFKSAYDYVNKTSGLKYSFEIPASKIQEIGGDNNTYIPVFIPLPSVLNGDNDYGKAMPCHISITKNIRQSSPPFPNPSVGGDYDTDYASLWLQYEGRSLIWDGNCGYVRTIYASDPYPHLCLKTDVPKYYRSGLIVWLRAGTNRSSRYTIYSNYPIVGNTPFYYVDKNGNKDTSYDFANVQPIFEEKDIGVRDGGTGTWYSYTVKPENVPDANYSNPEYNHGVLNIAQDGNGEEFMGYATESARVGNITPSIQDNSYVRFTANTYQKTEKTVTIGLYKADVLGVTGMHLYNFTNTAGLKVGDTFTYKGDTAVVESNNTISVASDGEIAKASGQTIVIGYTESGSVSEELPVNRAINSAQINGLEITKDSNGVLKIGDIIIPQKKLLWSSNTGSGAFTTSSSATITGLLESLKVGEKIEVVTTTTNSANGESWNEQYSFPCQVISDRTVLNINTRQIACIGDYTISIYATGDFKSVNISMNQAPTSFVSAKVTKIYKIVE